MNRWVEPVSRYLLFTKRYSGALGVFVLLAVVLGYNFALLLERQTGLSDNTRMNIGLVAAIVVAVGIISWGILWALVVKQVVDKRGGQADEDSHAG